MGKSSKGGAAAGAGSFDPGQTFSGCPLASIARWRSKFRAVPRWCQMCCWRRRRAIQKARFKALWQRSTTKCRWAPAEAGGALVMGPWRGAVVRLTDASQACARLAHAGRVSVRLFSGGTVLPRTTQASAGRFSTVTSPCRWRTVESKQPRLWAAQPAYLPGFPLLTPTLKTPRT